jgi:hypothetical protein
MTADHAAIRDALVSVPDVIEDTDLGRWYSLGLTEAAALAPTVARLIDDAVRDALNAAADAIDLSGTTAPLSFGNGMAWAARIVRDMAGGAA